VVSCWVRLSEIGLGTSPKPRVEGLGCQSNPVNFKVQERCQRRLDRLPSTKPHFVRTGGSSGEATLHCAAGLIPQLFLV